MQHFKDSYLNIDYDQNYLSKDEADQLLSFCMIQTKNNPDYMRSNILFGDEGLIYTDTNQGKTYHTKAITFPDKLISYKEKLEETTGHKYNFCSLMKYPNGSIVIKKHRDKEMTLGTSICGISVGETRRIQFSPTNYIKPQKYEKQGLVLELNHGSLYCMLPPTNDKWTHEILPESKEVGIRYSLTFRNMDTTNMLKEIPSKQTCKALLKTGNRKGQECGADTY